MIALLACLLLSPPRASAPAPGAEDSAAVFVQELQRVRRKMERGEWQVALRRLESALVAHEGGAYVLQHLGEVELSLERCLFWKQRGKVDLGPELKGELDYDLATGKLELRYAAGRPTGFERSGAAWVLPVVFSGPYSIELSGGPEPAIIVCAEEQQSVGAFFDRVLRPGDDPDSGAEAQRTLVLRSQLRERDGRLREETDSTEFESSGVQRRYQVAVEASSVRVRFNGRSLLARSKPRDLWGRIAFPGSLPAADIVIEGEARAWLSSRIDAAVEDDWRRFEDEWEFEQHVPAWLRDALRAERPGTGSPRTAAPEVSSTSAAVSPAELSAEDIETWNLAMRQLDRDQFASALRGIDGLLARTPRLAEGYRLKAKALVGQRAHDEAAEALRRGIEQVPGDGPLRRDLVTLLLFTGRFDETLAEVSAAVAAGFPSAEFQELAVTANKALRGPAWSAKNEFSSRHYSVASDLSREVCRKVALELEESFRHVSRRLRFGALLETRKFQVYVFSSERRYLDYISDVFGGRGDNTLGMYSPFLKQLLILDSPQHDLLMHTVRHEGFHQLFDSELDAPPTWLDEGLAESFAAARLADGGWQDGRVNAPRLAVLRERHAGELMPLAEFLYQDHATFLRDASLGYSQGWGLVHFLRNSTRENLATFEALLAALREGQSNRAALSSAFGGHDLAQLDVELAAFLAKL